MSINAISDVMRCGPVFKHAEKAALLSLANCVDDQGYCWPSVNEIAWNAGMTVRSIQRALPDLEDLGIIELVEKGGGRRANRYRVNVEWLAAAAASIFRKKKQANQNGSNRYDDMADVASAVRANLEKDMHDDPVRGPRWRKRHGKVEPRGDAESSPGGDTASGLNLGKKICASIDVTTGVTHGHPEVTQRHPSPDTTSPEPTIETSENLMDTLGADGIGPEPPPSRVGNASRLGEEEMATKAPDLPQALEPGDNELTLMRESTDFRSTPREKEFEIIDNLARKLGMRQHTLCMAVGAFTKAKELAIAWGAGAITLDEVNAIIQELGMDGESKDARNPLKSSAK